MMKKVLVIGAGIGQVPISLKIKARGLYLIIVTIPGEYPCIELADKVYYIDIFDKEKVLEIARLEQISAVVSDQNDLMMPTVAFVAENMGLPGNTILQVESYCNKNIFRDNCDRLGIPTPRHFRVTEENKGISEPISFPLMVKPEDSQSSIGVKKVNSILEYHDCVTSAIGYSRNKAAIVEEFFIGREVVVEGFIYKGMYYNLGFADRKYFNLDKLFIPSQTIFPSDISDACKAELISYESMMARYIAPEFAIVHSEYLINESGDIRIVESALRGGGVYISSHLIPLSTKIDINDILLDCVLGYSVDMDSIMNKREQHGAAYICFYLKEGVVSNVSGVDEIRRFPYIHKIDMNLNVGDISHKPTQKGQRLGPIILSGENREDLTIKIGVIQSLLKVCVNNEKECNAVVWS